MCKSLDVDIQELSDQIAIRDLLARYAHAVDSKDWDLYRTLFTDDAFIDYTAAGGEKGDVETIAAWLDQSMAMFEMTQHLIANELITIDGDTATVQAMFYNPMRFAGGGPLWHCGGWYHHELVRDGEGWKSRSLRETFAWTTMPGADG